MDYRGPNDYSNDVDQYQEGSMPHIFQLIERLGRRLKTMQRRTVGASGLTPPQYVVLSALATTNRRRLKELADEAHCTPATITGVVDVLERKGLVSRQPNPDDRRSLLVAITEEGKTRQRSTPTLDDMLHGCCSGLRPDDAAHLAQLLNQLDRSLESWEPAG
jgi:DNA-binding MarR family transcriptional regulator